LLWHFCHYSLKPLSPLPRTSCIIFGTQPQIKRWGPSKCILMKPALLPPDLNRFLWGHVHRNAMCYYALGHSHAGWAEAALHNSQGIHVRSWGICIFWSCVAYNLHLRVCLPQHHFHKWYSLPLQQRDSYLWFAHCPQNEKWLLIFNSPKTVTLFIKLKDCKKISLMFFS
jgi:hypothetical protein